MDLITMDDLTNDESISLLEDAMKLMPVARGLTHLPLGRKGPWELILRKFN